MKPIICALAAVVVLGGTAAYIALTSGWADEESAPVYA